MENICSVRGKALYAANNSMRRYEKQTFAQVMSKPKTALTEEWLRHFVGTSRNKTDKDYCLVFHLQDEWELNKRRVQSISSLAY